MAAWTSRRVSRRPGERARPLARGPPLPHAVVSWDAESDPNNESSAPLRRNDLSLGIRFLNLGARDGRPQLDR